MDRFALKTLSSWKVRRDRKPIVMRGARQVGKTWLVRQFAEESFESLVEINFEQTPDAALLFASNDPEKILPLLAVQFGRKVEPGRTLLFLDEVQAAPQVLLSLRYFFEKKPELHVIAAGSLLEFALADLSFSMPVGRIEYFFVDPMTFGEFLAAAGRGQLVEFLRAWRTGDDFPAPIHHECMELLRQYLTVGGMPESVGAYFGGGADFEAAERARQGILSTFADDFAKYARRIPVENIRKIFASVPRQLGEKFMWTKVDRDIRSTGLAAAFDLLCKARVTAKIPRANGNGLPFGADADHRNFKALFLDVGLASLACGLHGRDLVGSAEDLLLDNRCPIAEQFVGQELLAANESWSPRELFCWARESRSSNAEVDFLGASGGHVYPIEVKAGATGRLKSMHQFLSEKKSCFGLRFNGDVPSYVETDFADSSGERRPFRLLSLPLYLASESRRLAAEHAM